MQDSDYQGERDRLAREVHLSTHSIVRLGLVVLGTIALGLGIVGIFLPLLPTTPLLLLAAACYARGSERFYVWLLTNRLFGQYIRDWRENKGIPFRTKVWILLVLFLTLGITGLLFAPLLEVQLILASVGFGVTWYILRLPTKRPLAQEG